VKRRQLLKQLLSGSSGLIGAHVLAGCGRSLNPAEFLQLLDVAEPLPQHLITPIGEFYIQSYALPPTVNADTWKLTLAGAVQTPLSITLADILAAPQETFYLTMECIGNVVGGNQIGNALWQGTPLLPWLQKATIKPEATEIILHGADYYETTLPIERLLRPDVQLIHKMNGMPLTKPHGYPVRIIIPGLYGQKQPKWLVKLEAIAKPKRGYWERQGWSNTAEIATHALTRQVQSTRVWNRQHQVTLAKTGETGWQQGIVVAGVAIDKSTPIRQVQISLDGGNTWQQAEQNSPSSPHEWTLWRYRWRPSQPGRYSLMARAESDNGLQPIEDKNYRDGSSGVLKIDVTLAS